MARGVSVLYQELNVVDDLTVEENLTLGKERSRLRLDPHERRHLALVEILARPGRLRSGSPMRVGDLSVAQRQVIEIARAVSTDLKSWSWTSRPPR